MKEQGLDAWAYTGVWALSLGTYMKHKNKTCLINTKLLNRFVKEGNNLIISLKTSQRPFGVLMKVSYGDDKPWVQILSLNSFMKMLRSIAISTWLKGYVKDR